MNEDLNLQVLVAEFAAERLEVARNLKPGDENCSEAFKQAMEATKVYVDITKTDDAHMEELEKLELEKTKQEEERKFKKRASIGDRVMKTVEIIGVVVITPIITYKCNEKLVEIISKLEEFEVWKTTPGKSLSKMFKFGK